MKTPPTTLLDFIRDNEAFVIAGHKEPDGDCIGSCLAMESFLKRMGKRVQLVSAGPFKRIEIREYESRFIPKAIPEQLGAPAAVMILDCSNAERTGDAAPSLKGMLTSIIDHHATNEAEAPQDFVESSSPSTTLLVQSVIESLTGSVTKEEAEFLLFGLCTDTGFFRHLDDGSAESFAYAARLVAAGANPKRTFMRMNGGKSFESRILVARILSRMKRYYGGGLVISWETIEDTREFGLEGRDSDILYQLIQSISGVEAIVLVRQESETNCTVGFRSLDRVDVSIVASAFGGGGHRQASGLSVTGTIETLIPRFVEAFKPQFPGINP